MAPQPKFGWSQAIAEKHKRALATSDHINEPLKIHIACTPGASRKLKQRAGDASRVPISHFSLGGYYG